MSHVPESSFTKWLRKRRYINLSLIYLGTVLVIIHFGEMVIHGLHMPDITFSLLVVLALAGLPIVLLISWAFDLNKPAVKRGRKSKATVTVDPVPAPKIRLVNWIRRV